MAEAAFESFWFVAFVLLVSLDVSLIFIGLVALNADENVVDFVKVEG